VVLYENVFPDAPELAIFDTLVPQDDPRSLRWFRLPPVSVGRGVHVHLDRDRSLGAANRDGHLVVDPNQAILILSLFPGTAGLSRSADATFDRTRVFNAHKY